MERKQKKQVNGEAWLNTYADMVTLVLCFFVLLFSISSVDSAKWEVLVKSMNPNAKEVSQIAMDPGEGENPVASQGTGLLTDVKEFDQLGQQMQEYIQENNLSKDVDISKGDDFLFITFRNNIFFDGDSYILKPQGARVLDAFCEGMSKITDQIGEIRILGHTNQADPNKRNNIDDDRFLSSNRATEVLVYIQKKNIIDPKRLISIGYGQNWPIASFVTEEDRAKNRRVEILITKTQATNITLEEVYKSIGDSTPEVKGHQH